MSNKIDVWVIHHDEDAPSYLIKGELSRIEAINAVLHDERENVSMETLMKLTYAPGWYRKNPCNNGDWAWMIGDGKPGQPGAFKAVYLRREP